MSRTDVISQLCDLCPPGSVVYTIQRTASRTGKLRTLDFYIFYDTVEGKCSALRLTELIATVLELPLNKAGALVFRGRSPDPGFECVSRLSRELHGMLGKIGSRGPEQGIPCDVSEAVDYRAGYSLRQVWL